MLLSVKGIDSTNAATVGIIGGADGPTAIMLGNGTDTMEPAVISFDANMTTGFGWTGFVVGGDSVEINESESGYAANANPEGITGTGGKHYIKLDALKPGQSIIRFAYGRSWE